MAQALHPRVQTLQAHRGIEMQNQRMQDIEPQHARNLKSGILIDGRKIEFKDPAMFDQRQARQLQIEAVAIELLNASGSSPLRVGEFILRLEMEWAASEAMAV